MNCFSSNDKVQNLTCFDSASVNDTPSHDSTHTDLSLSDASLHVSGHSHLPKLKMPKVFNKFFNTQHLSGDNVASGYGKYSSKVKSPSLESISGVFSNDETIASYRESLI